MYADAVNSKVLTTFLVAMGTACAAAKGPPSSEPGSAAATPSAGSSAILAEHNRLRAAHCAAPLAWSAKLEKSAQAWADHLRDSGCAFEHSGGSSGENLAGVSIGAMDGSGVVRYWYDESAHYKYSTGRFSAETGHFTQVVWGSTREVGCGTSQCKGMDVWVCQYDPPGNVSGAFAENVKAKGCR